MPLWEKAEKGILESSQDVVQLKAVWIGYGNVGSTLKIDEQMSQNSVVLSIHIGMAYKEIKEQTNQ